LALGAARGIGDDLCLPLRITQRSPPRRHEADGLELPLRLGVLWQRLRDGPLRRTQQGEFFKRDWERLSGDGLLNSPLAEGLTELPDVGSLLVALAKVEGVLEEAENAFRPARLPAC